MDRLTYSNIAAGKRAVAVLVLSLFVFQLGQIYFMNRADALYACPYTEIWVSGPGGNQIFVSSISNSDESKIWGCKGSLFGVVMAPSQPLALPVAFVHPLPGWIYLHTFHHSDSPADGFFAPLLEPPRA